MNLKKRILRDIAIFIVFISLLSIIISEIYQFKKDIIKNDESYYDNYQKLTYDNLKIDYLKYEKKELPTELSFLNNLYDISSLNNKDKVIMKSIFLPKTSSYKNSYLNNTNINRHLITLLNYKKWYKEDEFCIKENNKLFIDEKIFKDVYIKIFGPDSLYEPISFEYQNDEFLYKYTYKNNKYFIEETKISDKKSSIFGTYEKVYKIIKKDDEIKVYTKLISYYVNFNLDIDNNSFKKEISMSIYDGFYDKEIKVLNDDFSKNVNDTFKNIKTKRVYTFVKSNDSKYYYKEGL